MLLQSAPPGPPAIQSPKNGRFQDPTPELLHQNLWVGGHLEICPEASFGGTNPFIWEKPLEQKDSFGDYTKLIRLSTIKIIILKYCDVTT